MILEIRFKKLTVQVSMGNMSILVLEKRKNSVDQHAHSHTYEI